MTKKNYLIIGGVATAAFAAGMTAAWLAFVPQQPILPTSEQQSVKTAPDGLQVIAKLIDERDKLQTIKVEYPQFPTLPNAFNKTIENEVTGRIAEFKQTVKENWQARQDTTPAGRPKEQYPAAPFEFWATWEPKQMNQNVISFVLRFESYEGGANERQELHTFNYDLRTGKEVALADLFPGDPQYLQTASKYARQQLAGDLATAAGGKEYVQADMLNDGTAPNLENFRNFVFSDNVVEFYFPKYQVAPGAFGEQHVIMLRRTAQ